MLIKCREINPDHDCERMLNEILSKNINKWYHENKLMWSFLSELIPTPHRDGPLNIEINPTELLVAASEDDSFHDHCIICIINKLMNQLAYSGRLDPTLLKKRIDLYKKQYANFLYSDKIVNISMPPIDQYSVSHYKLSCLNTILDNYPEGITIEEIIERLGLNRSEIDYKV